MQKVPWRLVLLLAILVCAAAFAALNQQRVDVSLGVYVFSGVPLFLALLVAFIAGAACVIPYALDGRKRAGGRPRPGRPAPSIRDEGSHP